MIGAWWRRSEDRPPTPSPDPAYRRRVLELTDSIRQDSEELRDLVAKLRRALIDEAEANA